MHRWLQRAPPRITALAAPATAPFFLRTPPGGPSSLALGGAPPPGGDARASAVRGGSLLLTGAVALAGVALMYAVARQHNPFLHTAQMHAAASALRRLRARARAQLLAAAPEAGAAAVAGGGLGGAAAGAQAIKWWASGPAVGADTVVLLAGGDGESAAVWGSVHAALAAALPRARVVSYHRAPMAAGAQRGSGVPLSLRVRDAALALAHAAGGVRGDARVVHVGAGEGAWAALAAAALLRPPRGAPAGAVLVAPVLQRRGKEEAWMDAVPAASRAPFAAGALARLLEPPRVLRAAGGGAGDASLRDALDARWERRREIATTDGAGKRRREGAAELSPAAERRFDEDFRARRAGGAALPPDDLSLLAGAAAALPPRVAVRVLAVGPGCAPPWLDAASARAHELKQAGAAAAAAALLAPAGGAVAARLAALRAEGAELAREDALAPLKAALRAFGAAEAAVDGATSGRGSAAAGKRERGGADALRAAAASLPLALGFFAQPPLRAAPAMRNIEAQLREAPPHFSLALLEGGGEGGEGGVMCVPLQRPEAVVREVLRVVENGAGAAAGARALEFLPAPPAGASPAAM
jgi:hypothetical protein